MAPTQAQRTDHTIQRLLEALDATGMISSIGLHSETDEHVMAARRQLSLALSSVQRWAADDSWLDT